MSDYVLSCCSTADVTRELLEERGIAYVYFNCQLDGQMLKDDFGQTNSPAQLSSKMLAGADAKTSQVSVGEYITHFEKFLTQGKDVLHVTLSSGISGTYGSACAARDQLAEKYPDRKVVIVDSLCASAGYGLLMASTSLRPGRRSTASRCSTGSSPATSRSSSAAGASPRPRAWWAACSRSAPSWTWSPTVVWP